MEKINLDSLYRLFAVCDTENIFIGAFPSEGDVINVANYYYSKFFEDFLVVCPDGTEKILNT